MSHDQLSNNSSRTPQRLCLDSLSDGLYTFCCDLPEGHTGPHDGVEMPRWAIELERERQDAYQIGDCGEPGCLVPVEHTIDLHNAERGLA